MVNLVVVGEVVGAFGIKGWVKVRSYTEPPENVLEYVPWSIGVEEDFSIYEVLAGRMHGCFAMAQLKGVVDRDQASGLRSLKVAIQRSALPALGVGHYYWSDLVGLAVENVDHVHLGVIAEMLATGANDVMVLQGDRERLIPFVIGSHVREVNLSQGKVIVDWDPEF